VDSCLLIDLLEPLDLTSQQIRGPRGLPATVTLSNSDDARMPVGEDAGQACAD
jgi:hypothetical protein